MTWRLAVAAGLLVLGGCVTAPPAPPPPAPPSPAVVEPPSRELACPSCDDQNREVVRLRHELAQREAELRESRTSQREQVKVLQESKGQAERAKVRWRRLATQADAASYIAEVEVALQALRKEAGGGIQLLALAEGILQSTAPLFAQGDYGAAMDLAAQAEQLVTVVADDRARRASPARAAGETPFQVAIPLRATVDGPLRRQPLPSAASLGVVAKDAPLLALARKGGWLRVETADGRAGWMDEKRVGVR